MSSFEAQLITYFYYSDGDFLGSRSIISPSNTLPPLRVGRFFTLWQHAGAAKSLLGSLCSLLLKWDTWDDLEDKFFWWMLVSLISLYSSLDKDV